MYIKLVLSIAIQSTPHRLVQHESFSSLFFKGWLRASYNVSQTWNSRVLVNGETLTELGFQIVNRKATIGDLVTRSSGKATGSDSESSSDATWQEPSLEVYLDDVAESVNKLVKITRAIRQSSSKYRSSKAQAYEDIEAGPDGPINHSEIFEKFIGEYLSKRYHETNGNVRARLQSAISCRRRHFAYRKRHQQKLFYGNIRGTEARSDGQAKSKIAITPPLLQPAETNTVPVHIPLSRINVRPNAPSTQITASTLRPDFHPLEIKSSIISGSSHSRLSRDPNDHLPPAPPLRAGERLFSMSLLLYPSSAEQIEYPR